jgi:hypothetical protein
MKRQLGKHLGDDTMMLKWVLKKQGRRVWTGFIGLRIGARVRLS